MTSTAAPPQAPAARPRAATHALRRPWALPEVRWAAAALALFVVAVVVRLVGAPDALWWGLFLACYAAGGWEPALAGLRAARQGRLDVDLLMVVAAGGAAAIGQVLDGGLLIVIFATSGALEAYATQRTEDAVRSLGSSAPQRATLLTDDGEREVAADEVAVGALVLVRPGELMPVDGTVVEGASSVAEASVTGEPLPAEKAAGSVVFAGTQTGDGVLRVRVDSVSSDTVVARIAAMVDEAARTRARRQLFIESVEQRYSVGVVMATLAVFGIPMLAGSDLDSALLRAMTFMIVASPCALVLATMPPLLAAIATASRHGVLVRSSVALERLAGTDAVVLDKTGTLTDGRPQVSHVLSRDGDLDAEDVLRLAAAAEQGSEHPVGRAVVAHARDRGVDLPAAEGATARPGRGITARVRGVEVQVVSPAAVPDLSAVQALVARVEAVGATVVVVVADGEPVGVLGLGDRVRPGAPDAVRRMGRLVEEVEVLSGDGEAAVRAVADEVGVAAVRARLLPEQKAARVRQLQEQGRSVLVVGDGVNDAPALAAADTGVAMGGIGADLTVDTADVIVVRDDLAAVPAAVELARRAQTIVRQNLVVAGTVVVVLVTWDLVGHLPLPLGVAGHEGSTIAVALNGLRLLRRRAWPSS